MRKRTKRKKSESEPLVEDEALRLEKEKIRDLDVPDEKGENIRGGAVGDTRGNCWGHTDTCACSGATCGNCW